MSQEQLPEPTPLPFFPPVQDTIQLVSLEGTHDVAPCEANGFILIVKAPQFGKQTYTVCGRFTQQVPHNKDAAISAIFQTLHSLNVEVTRQMFDKNGRPKDNWKECIHFHPLASLYLPFGMTAILCNRVIFVQKMFAFCSLLRCYNIRFSPSCGFNE